LAAESAAESAAWSAAHYRWQADLLVDCLRDAPAGAVT
jgi:hypothetical protein